MVTEHLSGKRLQTVIVFCVYCITRHLFQKWGVLHCACDNPWFNVGIVRAFLTLLWSVLFVCLMNVTEFLWNSWQFRHQLGFLMLTGSLFHTLHDHHCEQLLAICGAGTADETALLATWSARQWGGHQVWGSAQHFPGEQHMQFNCRGTYTSNSVSHVYMQGWSDSDKRWWHLNWLYVFLLFVASWCVGADMCQLHCVGGEWPLGNEWCAGRMWFCLKQVSVVWLVGHKKDMKL